MSAEDPRPGRWLLPVVIVAMIGFTYLFVTSVDAGRTSAEDSDDGATTTTTTTQPPDESTTTTTTTPSLSPAIQAYVAGLETAKAESTRLGESATAINLAWDERTTDFATTRDALDGLAAETVTFRQGLDSLSVPSDEVAELATGNTELLAAADVMVSAAQGMAEGIRAPDTGEARRSALANYTQAVATFNQTADRVAATATG